MSALGIIHAVGTMKSPTMTASVDQNGERMVIATKCVNSCVKTERSSSLREASCPDGPAPATKMTILFDG